LRLGTIARERSHTLASLLAWAALAVCVACSPASRTTTPARPVALEPRWQDIFEATPEFLVVVRAKALREDRVYGPLLRRALELVREQSRAALGASALDVLSDAEELVLAVRQPSTDGGETVLVARGVRADVDPANLVDDDGRPLWTLGPPGPVRELTREADVHGHAVAASLFELGGRTWVIAEGAARQRAREAFAHPLGRPLPTGLALPQDSGLAVARVDGDSLVRRVHALADLGGLAALGHHLRSVTIVVPPGAARTIRAVLAYGDDDSAAAAAVRATEALGAVARSGRESLAYEWLSSATVQHTPNAVVITAPIPSHVASALPGAGPAP
jgi:hypothetical protein